MKTLSTFILLLFSNFLIAQHSTSLTKAELLDSLLQESHRRGIFNGNALVAENGKVIYHRAVGQADASGNKPLNTEARFNIGSVSKEFDGTGIMILKEEGRLSLDDRLSAFFPQLPEWADAISVKNLLQYSSGIPNPDYNNVRTDAEVWQYLKGLRELKFDPGSEYVYNNTNVFLRKRIIEKVSGMSYAAFVETRMLRPCGMRNTVIDPSEETPRFTRSFDEAFVQDDLDTYMSGWIATTTEDLFKWVKCLNSGKLISSESLAELSESLNPSVQSPLGHSVYDKGNLQIRYHHGQSDNFEALMAWIPDPGYTIILLTNNRCNELGDHINAIDAILRGNEFQIPKRSIELSLRAKIFHEGYDSGIDFLKEIRKNQSDIFNFEQEEEELLETGEWLLQMDRQEEGMKIFEYTAARFPNSVRAYLELAKAHEDAGHDQMALKNYRKVQELEPENELAAEKLQQLE
ncbi:CubicO group peptidase, beta-lactamase class C family [Salinimicrobium catena]|uniref:CubicO group peptidase, beta-lactamase class C family n=1 Tax=Salinimicrobium catena TaxID=390640 RepID=A0A1H5P908_9FLAO|nr:serine hydrolase domain-containing protein [Salinimicrobium catena]SDL70256.1 CubicO group peptidase, beta-lactamase class C family [Salinimicrobium catena]SEF09561.1 CubicO group peptidase, beta-lactamase class C family [Salinimicrobium catena]